MKLTQLLRTTHTIKRSYKKEYTANKGANGPHGNNTYYGYPNATLH